MRLATDSAHTILGRSSRAGMLLVTCATCLGCSQLQAFRKESPPAFGTAVASKTEGKFTKGNDLYAARFREAPSQTAPDSRDKPLEAGADDQRVAVRSTSAGSAARAADGGSRPTVTLQPPVPLPVAGDQRTAVASRTQADGWITGEAKPALASSTTNPKPDSEPSPATQRERRQASGISVESLIAATRARLEGLTSYQVSLDRQERVDSVLQPAEVVLLSIRRKPKAVRLEWPEGSHKGREVIYSASENGGLMHVNMADSIVPVPRLSIAPDNFMVLRNSRHPITEAGFDTIVYNLEQSLSKSKVGDLSGGKITYGGMEQVDGLDQPCHKVIRLTPNGETWLVYLDPKTKFPAMVKGTGRNGELLERYVFRNVRPNVAELARSDAFNPDQRWGEAPGLLSRIARGASAGPRTSADTATR
jgi:hypothetical protein